MAVSPRPSNGWATPADWANRRALIISLYQDRNKTLKETMRIMEQKHQFYATIRMYKSRFLAWGIEKKLKAEDALEIYRQVTYRAKAGKPSVVLLKDRKINMDRLQRYRYRAPPEVAAQFAKVDEEVAAAPSTEYVSKSSRIVCRTPSPAPEDSLALSPRLDDPTDLGVAHDCMQILAGYITAAVESGAWQSSSGTGPVPDAFTWAHYLATSQGLMAHNRSNEGFTLLNICFEQYKTNMLNPDPFFWLATYKAALLLSYRDMKLGKMFMEYASGLTAFLLPRNHPFNQVWSRIMVTGLAGLQECAAALFESYLRIWQQQVGLLSADHTSLVQMGFVFIQLQCSGMICYNFAKQTLEAMMALLSYTVSSEFLLQEAKFRMACLFLEQNELYEAGTMIEHIMAWVDSLPKSDRSEFIHLRCKCLWTMFEIRERQGHLGEASRIGLGLFRLCNDTYGPAHLQTLDAISALESFYIRHNNIVAARAVSKQFESRWFIFDSVAKNVHGFPHTIEQPWLHRCVELGEDQMLIQQAVDLLAQCRISDF
ncbi:hypothetical protein GGR50DRAFT_646903 [Xylaria sp. CBS 124048]|nr:hypothetical protein GGR50DRAFT_646903 [Xylaria sp. CBS 124048]